MSDRSKKRADRIRSEVSISDLLHDLGYRVHADPGGRQQQYACDLHGDGSDGKPSARVYPGSNSTYCFACGRARDPIQFVREKVGKDFFQALHYLEDKYGLAPLLWEEEAEPELDLSGRVREILSGGEAATADNLLSRAEKILRRVLAEQYGPPILVMLEEHDRIRHLLSEGVLGEQVARASAAALLEDVMVAEESA